MLPSCPSLPLPTSGGSSPFLSLSLSRSCVVRAPRAKYTMVGEVVRYVIPGPMQCSMGCGGQACKYENPSFWSEDDQAIVGLYSSWWAEHCYSRIHRFFLYACIILHSNCILCQYFHRCRVTDYLLAMSRPSTEIIEKYNIIDQFKRYIQFFLDPLIAVLQVRMCWC